MKSRKLNNKIQKKKATRGNTVKNEAWIYRIDRANMRLREIMIEVLRGSGLPKTRKEGEICPIYKKEGKGEVKNYALPNT